MNKELRKYWVSEGQFQTGGRNKNFFEGLVHNYESYPRTDKTQITVL